MVEPVAKRVKASAARGPEELGQDELGSQLRLLDYVFDDVEPPMFPDTLVVVESLTPTLVASPMLTPTVLESYSDGSGKSEGE